MDRIELADIAYAISSSGELVLKADESRRVRLPANQLKLIGCLVRNAGNTLSRETLADNIWSELSENDISSINVMVSRLRSNMNKLLPGLGNIITTEKGYGYRLILPEKEKSAPAPSGGSPVSELSAQMDALVAEMEQLQEKLEEAVRRQNPMWTRVYQMQLENSMHALEELNDMLQLARERRDKLCIAHELEQNAPGDVLIPSGVSLSLNRCLMRHPEVAAGMEVQSWAEHCAARLEKLSVPESAQDLMRSLRRGFADILRRAAQLCPKPAERVTPAEQKAEPSTQVRTARFNQLLELGYSPMDIAERLVENDMKLYNNTPEEEGEPEQWAEYLSSYSDSFGYILNDQDRIVGNFSFLALDDEMAERVLRGDITESDFDPADTADLFCAGEYNMFLLNMSLNDEYSTPANNTLLRGMFLERIAEYAESDIYFKRIIVNAFKKSHMSFFSQWGFELAANSASGRIYKLDMLPYPEKLDAQLGRNRGLCEINERLRYLYGAKKADL